MGLFSSKGDRDLDEILRNNHRKRMVEIFGSRK